MVRLIVLLALLLGCTPSTGEPAAADTPPLFYAVDGGIAVVAQSYTVAGDGTVQFVDRRQPAVTRRLPDGAASVADLLAKVRATNASAQPVTKGEPIMPCCDRRRHEIRFVLDGRLYRYVFFDGDNVHRDLTAARDLIRAAVEGAK